jgi:hypothetical protein
LKLSIVNSDILEWILRFGVFGVFLGHGVVAMSQNPAWIPLLTPFGFSVEGALNAMRIIGFVDILVAFSLLVYPMRIVLLWAVFWAFATAISRPLAGFPVWSFVERTANWTTPLALLLLYGFPKSYEALFKNN